LNRLELDQLKKIRQGQEQALIINVLSEREFRKEHIPGSISIPLEEDNDFAAEVKKAVPDPSHKVIVYCANTDCPASDTAAKELEKAGFEDVWDFEGGIQEWKEAGEPVDQG